MDICERIKYLRTDILQLTQTQFAEKLVLSRNFIAQMDAGNRQPSDRTIKDICETYDINEEWLRTGEGEIKRQLSRDEQITDFVGEVLKDTPESFRKRFISMLSAMSADEWALLEQMATRLLNEKEE
jgi:transcriptional regulator with XRE-family HTH domain